jgi:hypothetical protein
MMPVPFLLFRSTAYDAVCDPDGCDDCVTSSWLLGRMFLQEPA